LHDAGLKNVRLMNAGPMFDEKSRLDFFAAGAEYFRFDERIFTDRRAGRDFAEFLTPGGTDR
jgi:hypothetical protein